MVVSVKFVSFRGFAQWPHDQGLCPWTPMGHNPRRTVVAVHFGYRFVCGPSLQISCAPLHCIVYIRLKKQTLVWNC